MANTPGDYVISYTAVDLSGNEAKMLERQVSVVDTTAPEIRIAGLSTVIHEAGTAYSDEGATATDLGSSVNVTTSGTVDASTVGSYTITYSAKDGTNTATGTRTVNVVDTKAPVITLNGQSSVIHEAGDEYMDLSLIHI